MRDDHSTTVEELKTSIKEFCDARDWDQYHDAKELAISINIESAELLELFRFKRPADIRRMFENPGQREKICGELSDVLFATLRFAQLYDIDVAGAFGHKMKENERKYPVEKARGSNLKYDEF